MYVRHADTSGNHESACTACSACIASARIPFSQHTSILSLLPLTLLFCIKHNSEILIFSLSFEFCYFHTGVLGHKSNEQPPHNIFLISVTLCFQRVVNERRGRTNPSQGYKPLNAHSVLHGDNTPAVINRRSTEQSSHIHVVIRPLSRSTLTEQNS